MYFSRRNSSSFPHTSGLRHRTCHSVCFRDVVGCVGLACSASNDETLVKQNWSDPCGWRHGWQPVLLSSRHTERVSKGLLNITLKIMLHLRGQFWTILFQVCRRVGGWTLLSHFRWFSRQRGVWSSHQSDPLTSSKPQTSCHVIVVVFRCFQ